MDSQLTKQIRLHRLVKAGSLESTNEENATIFYSSHCCVFGISTSVSVFSTQNLM